MSNAIKLTPAQHKRLAQLHQQAQQAAQLRDSFLAYLADEYQVDASKMAVDVERGEFVERTS